MFIVSHLFGVVAVLDYIDRPLPTLHAVSAMGTRLRFYSKPWNGPVTPHCIPPDPDLLLEVEHWDYDILEEDGVQKFQAIVDEITKGCATPRTRQFVVVDPCLSKK